MADYFDMINPQQMDVIREIGNIGAGNAATALSAILGRKVCMSVPEVRVIPLSSVPEILGGPEDPVVGGMVDMGGRTHWPDYVDHRNPRSLYSLFNHVWPGNFLCRRHGYSGIVRP